MHLDQGFLIACAVGIFLDLILGDPRRMPHITRYMGWLSIMGEKLLVPSLGRTVFSGLVLWLLTCLLVVGPYLIIAHYLSLWNPWAKTVLDALLIFQAIAFRDLVKHVRDVEKALAVSIEEARTKVSWIVGRDTDQMDESDVCRAAIESGAENLNDAVIAPVLWLLVGGPIGALIYRTSNTLDAMVGHRTERFEKLGKVSARIDDVLNYIPARICAALIWFEWKTLPWSTLKQDAIKHPSINAGWPEAAMCRRLNVVIGGRMYEGGALVQTAEMNEGARQPTGNDVIQCTHIMGFAYFKLLLVASFVGLLIYCI